MSRQLAVGLAVAALALGGAHAARDVAKAHATAQAVDMPYAPSPSSAPYVALGYRELAADLLFVRLVGYYGSPDNEARGIAALAEAIAALDPHYKRIYEWGAIAMTSAMRGVDQSTHLRAIALLEQGAKVYPDNWRLPNLAGQIYLVDLQTTDPAQRRAWDEQGTRLLDIAAHKPDAPAESAMTAAYMRGKLGQHQRAVDGLREMLLLTSDAKARQRIIDKLAELEHADADELGAELLESRKEFEDRWHRERPAVTASMYLLVGPRLTPGFDLGDLAVGGRAPAEPPPERLEPLGP